MKSAKAEGLVLRAAIYARKSTDDNDKSAEDKSVERQIAHSKEFIKSRGWQFGGAEFVFTDDAISGAEFKNRPGLQRLLSSLPESGRPPFDVLIMSEHSRLGRDIRNTAEAYGRILDSGVKVFFYLSGEQMKLDGALDEVMNSFRGFGSMMERESAVARARDAALKRAKEGRNFGGRCYGYDNVWVLPDGTEQPGTSEEFKPKIAKTVYRINPAQAEVVRAMFRMYADGYGAKAIAYCVNCTSGDLSHRASLKRYFNGKRPAAPRNAETWSSNTIHDLLRNPRYFGFIPYGGTQKKYVRGTKRRIRAEEQLIPMPELRIVDAKLEAAVRQRVARMSKIYLRSTNGQLNGRPQTGRASKYLLSGLVRCQECGSAMIVSSGSIGSGKKRQSVKHYVCSGRSNRGPSTCSNGMRPPMAALDSEVLAAVQNGITPNVIRAAARKALEMIRAKNAETPNKAKQLRQELAKAEASLQRWVSIFNSGGGKLDTAVTELAAAEARRDALKQQLAEADSPPVLEELSREGIERRLAARERHWKEVLAAEPLLQRQALKGLLAGPIHFTPDGEGFRLRGATKISALWNPETLVKMASPRGFEPRLPP